MPKAKNGNVHLRPVTLGAGLMVDHMGCDGKSCHLMDTNIPITTIRSTWGILSSSLRTPSPTRNPSNKGKCFYCQGEGHWKRNCPKFLESYKTKEKVKQRVGGTFSKLFASKCSESSSKAWVLDTCSSSHFSSSLEDLVNEKRLR